VRDTLIGLSVSVQLPQHGGGRSIYEVRNPALLARNTGVNILILVILSTQKSAYSGRIFDLSSHAQRRVTNALYRGDHDLARSQR